MDTAATIERTRGPVRLARRHPTAGAAGVCLVLVLARSALAGPPAATPGVPACRHMPRATMVQYQTGAACPPAAFRRVIGYEPELVSTPAGWRYTRPESAGGGCSGPMSDAGPFWDFGAACRAHDYGYDLVRLGVGDRGQADLLLYRDMRRSCSANFAAGVSLCRTLADSAHAVLWIGETTPGFEPEARRLLS